jgi:hypothetical protein
LSINKLILLLIICTEFAFAQNFFPLKVGNSYQVKNDWWWDGPGGTSGSGTDFYSIVVTEDTAVNGEVFFRFTSNELLGDEYLFNYDSLDQKTYLLLPNDSTKKLGVHYNVPSGYVYTSYIRGTPIQFVSEGISTKFILGDSAAVYSMMHYGGDIYYIYQFANKIGLSYFNEFGGFIGYIFSSEHNIISAVIDSIIYNPLILKVDSLYPVIDRPIDTFPFLLSIPYSASYYQLIDSFYLSVELVRDDSLIQNYIYDISISNPNLSLYLEDLEVGDIIKLRATITDTSIYYNVDHYPDTGWAVINVLSPILNIEDRYELFTYRLEQNYPNPFNPATAIKFEIPENQNVELKIFDVIGNEVETLINEEKAAGRHEIKFDGSLLPSGVYFYQLRAGSFIKTRKMVIAK